MAPPPALIRFKTQPGPRGTLAAMKRTIVLLLLASGAFAGAAAAETEWRIETAVKYDAACAIGILAEDPFYSELYSDELTELRALLSPATFAAAGDGYALFKEAQVLAGPWLALAWSAVDGDGLSDVLAATRHPAEMRRRLGTTDYWDESRWALFERAQPLLVAMLEGLQRDGFEDWWRRAAERPSRDQARQLAPRLAGADIVPLIEKATGRSMPSSQVTLYAARLCRPHGIRVTGTRFLLDIVDSSDPLRIAGATAIHEMLHPPFDDADPRIAQLVELLKEDEFVYGRWQEHDPAFGYNTFEGYLDENVTKALDQVIGERFGMTYFADPAERWIRNDDGMHVLAAAVYELMKAEDFLDGGEDATAFLHRMVRERKLAPGRIEPLVPERLRLRP